MANIEIANVRRVVLCHLCKKIAEIYFLGKKAKTEWNRETGSRNGGCGKSHLISHKKHAFEFQVMFHMTKPEFARCTMLVHS